MFNSHYIFYDCNILISSVLDLCTIIVLRRRASIESISLNMYSDLPRTETQRNNHGHNQVCGKV